MVFNLKQWTVNIAFNHVHTNDPIFYVGRHFVELLEGLIITTVKTVGAAAAKTLCNAKSDLFAVRHRGKLSENIMSASKNHPFAAEVELKPLEPWCPGLSTIML